jgi:tRNA-2-methylthio-N6-dimethylallyladenosine synthase
MNFSDSDVVVEILKGDFEVEKDIAKANLILVNTCSIRENAETRVFGRLKEYKRYKKQNGTVIGVLGCMAERLKEKLLDDEIVDLVVGPDSYRELPKLINGLMDTKNAIHVDLSLTETYDQIFKSNFSDGRITDYVSIMRGCNQFCSYCIVPYVRGRERSKAVNTIVDEIRNMVDKGGIKEVTLLGQNVDSYNYKDGEQSYRFSDLLEIIAKEFPKTRIRFATSHPKDMLDEVIITIAKYDNICNFIHLPLQSGSSKVLKSMRRGYTREWYMNRIETIKKHIPDCGLSTDVICGFCDETEEEFQETMEIMKEVEYDSAFMFYYSNREGTYADKRLEDNVDIEVKKRRLQEVIDQQMAISLKKNKEDVGKTFEVLVESYSKKSDKELFGRNSQNKGVVFPAKNYKIGDFVNVKITDCTAAALLGEAE